MSTATNTTANSKAKQRTPQQVATDALRSVEKQIAKQKSIMKAAEATIAAATKKLEDLETMRKYRASHPALRTNRQPTNGGATDGE